MSYLPPVNFRATPVRVGSPEAFTVSGGFALLAEAPADPASYGTIINIAGNVRNRVDVAPSAGQYRILTQTVTGSDLLPHLEYLPVLQFHSSDEGLAGTADYYATGTILTAQFFAMLLAFLTPLTGVANTGNLPAATMDPSERGRPGDVAFLADGSGYFSDGSSWLPFASGATPGSSFSLGQIMGMALDSGYVGPSFTVDTDLGAATVGFSPNAVWAGALAWTGDTTIAQIVGMTSDASAAEIASVSVGQTLGMSYDAILALVGAPSDYAATFGATLDGTWAAGGSPVSYVGAGTAGFAAAGSATVGIPAGIQNNDILVLVTRDNLGTSVDHPSGWTQLSASQSYLVIYWKRTNGTESSVVLPCYNDGQDDFLRGGRIFAFRNCVTSGSPFDVTSAANQTYTASGNTFTGAGITTTAQSMILFAFSDSGGGRSTDVTACGGSVDTVVSSNSGTPTYFAIALGYSATPPAAGAQAAPTMTYTGTSGGSVRARTLSLKPA